MTAIGTDDEADVSNYTVVGTAAGDTIHTIVFKPVSKTVTVAKDGVYRFAIKAMENTGLAVYVKDIKLSEGSLLAAPDSVTALKVVPGAKGVLKAVVTFTAPDKTIDGKTLSSISGVKIYDGNAMKAADSLQTVVPGKEYTVEVPVSSRGTHTFRVVAANAQGAGVESSASAYIGEDTPFAPKNITLVDNLDGTCKLTWDAPDTIGVHGGYVSPDNLTYTIYSVTDNTPSELKNGIKGNSYELGAFDQENRVQKLIYYAMKAVSGDTQSDYAVSSSLLSGAPYNLPVEESWKNGSQKYFWASNAVVGDYYFQWFTQISADNDGGCAYYGATDAKAGDRAVLSSGKISLSGSSNPKLFFDYYLISNGAHKINVNVKTAHGVKETLKTIDFDKEYAADKTEGWKTVVLDLSKYKDEKYITVEFDATIGNPKALVLLDDFRVKDVYDYDLSTAISGPATVKTGSKSKFTVTVSNEGLQPMSDYTVNLYVNGTVAATKTISEELKSSEKKSVDYDYAVPANAKDTLKVKATVSHDFDIYDKEGRVHVNWGWYGEDNGYFYVAYLNPYHGGNAFAFNSAQDMIININPDVATDHLNANVSLSEAGTLYSRIDATKKFDYDTLKVTGPINGTDIRLIREMAGRDAQNGLTEGRLHVLDLKDARIVSGGDAYLTEDGKEYRTADDALTDKIFYGCSFLTVTLPEGIKTVGDGVLAFCNGLDSVSLSDADAENFKVVDGTIYNKVGDEVISVLPNKTGNLYFTKGITKIHPYALAGCNHIRQVKLSSTVQEIGQEAFNDCINLNLIKTYSKTVPTLSGADVFKGVPTQGLKVYVPRGYKSLYTSADQWKDLGATNYVEFGTTIKARNATREVGQENPEFSYQVIGDYVDGKAELTCDATKDIPAGKYKIHVAPGTITEEGVEYIDGWLIVRPSTTAIEQVNSYEQGTSHPAYLLDGRTAGKQSHGIVIENRKKVMR